MPWSKGLKLELQGKGSSVQRHVFCHACKNSSLFVQIRIFYNWHITDDQLRFLSLAHSISEDSELSVSLQFLLLAARGYAGIRHRNGEKGDCFSCVQKTPPSGTETLKEIKK